MPAACGNGASLMCSFGAAPGTLTVPPTGRVTADNMAVATVLDHKPNVNIAPFAMCSSPSNPQVAAATSAAMGVLTPQPCVPATTTPWSPGATKVTVGGTPVLTQPSTCNCMWGGVITVSNPGTATCQVT